MKGRPVPEPHPGMVFDRKTGDWRPPQRDGLSRIHRQDKRQQKARKERKEEQTDGSR